MGATHNQCMQTATCAIHTKFCIECTTCGFYRSEHDRRIKLPLTYCEDGLRRYLVSAEDAPAPLKASMYKKKKDREERIADTD